VDVSLLVEACTVPAFLWKASAKHIIANGELQRRRGAEPRASKPTATQVFRADSLATLSLVSNRTGKLDSVRLNVIAQNGLTIPTEFRLTYSPGADPSSDQGYVAGFALGDQAAEVQTTRAELKPASDFDPTATGQWMAAVASAQPPVITPPERDTSRVSGVQSESPTALTSGALAKALAEDATFRAIVERLVQGLILVDQDADIVWANTTAATITGRSAEELLSTSLYSLAAEHDQAELRQVFRGEVQRGAIAGCQATIANPSTGPRNVAIDFFPAQRSAGLFAVTIRDVTGEARLTRAVYSLAEAPPRGSPGDLVARVGRSLGVRLAALVQRDSVERDRFVISHVAEQGVLAPHPSVAEAAAVDRIVRDFLARRGPAAQSQYMTISQDETTGCVMSVPVAGATGSLSGIVVCIHPTAPESIQTTERILLLFAQRIAAELEANELEAKLLQARESETLRHLARGIAHEFNNVLMRISGNLQLLGRRIESESQLQKYIESGLTAVKHGAAVVREVEDFSTNQSIELEPLSLASVIHRAKKLWDKSIPEGATLSVTCPEPLVVLGNKGALLEVLGQLIRNSIDAIGEAQKRDAADPNLKSAPPRHKISLALSRVSLPNGVSLANISVTDSGIGMSEQVASQVFDPFFTTKEPGRGTGLGLSIAQAMVAKHQGRIEVAGAVGRGSRFQILIPAIDPTVGAGEGSSSFDDMDE